MKWTWNKQQYKRRKQGGVPNGSARGEVQSTSWRVHWPLLHVHDNYLFEQLMKTPKKHASASLKKLGRAQKARLRVLGPSLKIESGDALSFQLNATIPST